MTSTTASTAPGRARPRRRIRIVAPALLLLVAGAAAYFGWTRFYGSANPRDLYQIGSVQRGSIEDLVTATGTVQPRDYVDVGAQVSGQLKKLNVEVGSVVKSGELLAEIDPTVLTATLDARRAGLRNQQATLLERESAMALATLQYARQKSLMADDATTTEALQLAEASLRATKAQIAAVKAQIDQTQSTLRADEANLNYSRIYAPMSGTVVSLTARQGQTLNANQSAPTILRIADLSTMTVQTQVSEAEVGKLRTGMEVYFTTLGSQGRRWYGALRKVEPTPTVTNNVVLYNALFDVPNANQALLPSMTTQVFFIAAQARDTLVVPTPALTLTRAGERGAAASAPGASRAASAPAGPARPASDVPGGAIDLAGLSPEQRRAAFEKMTPEERSAMRERRRSRPSDASTDAGAGGSNRGPRQATVRVIDAAGRIEERPVTIGVGNRVQVQVLSGLKEGDEVVTGMKPPPAARQAAAAQQQPQQQRGAATGGGFGPGPGAMPPGGGR